jgi:hypothetical protein
MAAPWEKYQADNGDADSGLTAQGPWSKFQKAPANDMRFQGSIQKSLPTLDEASTATQSALQGFGNQATFGHLPQLNAAVEPVAAKIADLVTGGNSYETIPDYATRRDQWIAQQLAAKNASPKAYTAGQVGGGLSTGLAIPLGAAAEAGLPLQMLSGAGSAIAQSALQNPGDQPGVVNPLQLSERASNVVNNPTNIAVNALAPAVGPALNSAGGLLSALAERKAFKALGPYARQAMQAFNRDKVNSIGRTALDEGVVTMPPTSYAGLENRANAAASTAGQNLGNTVEQMAQKETGAPVSLSREDIANNLENKLISPADTDIGGVANKNAQLQELINNWRSGGGESAADLNPNIPLLEAELKKRNVADQIKWDRLPGADIPIEEQFNRSLLGQLKNGVEQGGEDLAQKTGYPVDQFIQQKNTYGDLQAAKDILAKRNAKEFANRLISPSDYAIGALGAGAGLMSGGSPEDKMKHALLGTSLALVNKGARKYGNQISAVGLNRLGQAVDAAGNVIPEVSGAAARGGIWNILNNQNEENKP